MILPSEIRKIAEHNRVPTSTIDKDWVLGHLLAEIGRHEWAQKNLLFKGGTCLKKCYFPEYQSGIETPLKGYLRGRGAVSIVPKWN